MAESEQSALGHETFRAIVEASVSPFVIVDSQGFVTWVGPRVDTLLGEHPLAYVGRHFLDMIDPASHEPAIAAFSDFVADPGGPDAWIGPPMVLDLVRADGSVVACEISASLGAPYGIDGAVLQVSRSRTSPLLYDAVDSLAVGAPIEVVLTRLAVLCEHDTPGSSVAIGWNWDGSRFGNVIRTTVSSTIKVPPPSLDRPEPTPWHDAMAKNVIQGGHDLALDDDDLAAEARAAGFATCWVIPITVRSEPAPTAALVLWRQRPGDAQPHLTTTAQRVARLVAFSIESHQNIARLHDAATTDELTGLANRVSQRHVISDLLANGDQISVLFCDLDNFKPVNDEHGHDLGDRVLAIVAQRMRDAIRAGDHLSRWGGDEFVVTTAAREPEEVEALADRLIATVSAPIVVDDRELQVGLSVGIATATADSDADELLQRSDDALREAKVGGKNRWKVRGS